MKVGDKFKGGMFNLLYVIVKVNKTTCWVEHNTGEKIMRGGKWVDEVYLYKNVKISRINSMVKQV